MSGSLRLGILIVLAVVAIGLAYKLVTFLIAGLLGLVWQVLFPLAVVVGIGLLLYSIFSRKPLGGGGRRYLP